MAMRITGLLASLIRMGILSRDAYIELASNPTWSSNKRVSMGRPPKAKYLQPEPPSRKNNLQYYLTLDRDTTSEYLPPICAYCDQTSDITFDGMCNDCSPKVQKALSDGRISYAQYIGLSPLVRRQPWGRRKGHTEPAEPSFATLELIKEVLETTKMIYTHNRRIKTDFNDLNIP